jgi:hypothetical protein
MRLVSGVLAMLAGVCIVAGRGHVAGVIGLVRHAVRVLS